MPPTRDPVKGDLVLVYWQDAAAHGQDGWQSDAEISENATPVRQVTGGIFFERNDHAVVIIRTLDSLPDGYKEGAFQIPLGCVNDVWIVKTASQVLKGRAGRKPEESAKPA